MTKRAVLIILTILSFLYCFRLGFIWTPYGHGLKFLIGFHFPLIMTISTILFQGSKANAIKEKLFVIGAAYFFTIAAFSLTIEYLIKTKPNYFNFLYYDSGGYADKIYFCWLTVGIISIFIMLRQWKRLSLTDKNYPLE